MPRKPTTPTYRHHKATNQAFVVLNSRTIYLGKFETPESREKYNRVLAEYFSRGRQVPSGPPTTTAFSVGQLALRYLEHVDAYYRHPDGTPTSETQSMRLALRPLNRLYSRLPAVEFSPLKLKAVREEMIRRGWVRTHINRQVSRLRQMFKWAASEELIPGTTSHALAAVGGLRAGRSDASESIPVKPVPQHAIDAVLPLLPPAVQTMIHLQKFSGMRPQEVNLMRTCDIQTDGPAWTYRPPHHKTSHHGHERVIHLGPAAQAILKPWLKTDLQAFLFSPAEAEATRNQNKRMNRLTPMTPSQARRQRRQKPSRAPGNCYTVDS